MSNTHPHDALLAELRRWVEETLQIDRSTNNDPRRHVRRYASR